MSAKKTFEVYPLRFIDTTFSEIRQRDLLIWNALKFSHLYPMKGSHFDPNSFVESKTKVEENSILEEEDKPKTVSSMFQTLITLSSNLFTKKLKY